MSCVVDDGTGQATLELHGATVHRLLRLSEREVREFEILARGTRRTTTSTTTDLISGGGGGGSPGMLEFSSARKVQAFAGRSHAGIAPVTTSSSGVPRVAPSEIFCRCVDRPQLLRRVIVFGVVQRGFGLLTKTTIDLGNAGNDSKVQSKTLSKMVVDCVHVEEMQAATTTLESWRLLEVLER